jgi:SAM-dependent methyltransferase
MGRFASTVNFYARYREPYPPEFFKKCAEQIALHGDEILLDIGCGPGLLAIGFAPFVRRCTGLDPEAGMIAAARTAAAETGVELSLIHGRIEEFPTTQTYDVITIGRALHLMERSAALPVLEQIACDSGRILICGASGVEAPETASVESNFLRSEPPPCSLTSDTSIISNLRLGIQSGPQRYLQHSCNAPLPHRRSLDLF